MAACEKCQGTGKITKPISQREMGEFPCDMCDGTGNLPDGEKEIMEKLDRIIKLLELIAANQGKYF